MARDPPMSIEDMHADHEGFIAAPGQSESAITEHRHPRAALGSADGALIAMARDGRRCRVYAGLSMLEPGR